MVAEAASTPKETSGCSDETGRSFGVTSGPPPRSLMHHLFLFQFRLRLFFLSLSLSVQSSVTSLYQKSMPHCLIDFNLITNL